MPDIRAACERDGLQLLDVLEELDVCPAGRRSTLLCPDCQTPDAIVEYMARMAEADELIAMTMRDQAVDDELGRPAAGRPTDTMMGHTAAGGRT